MIKILVLLSLILLSGCAVSPQTFNEAERACESHGGVKWLYVFPYEQLKCNDGTVIKTIGNRNDSTR